QDQTVFGQPLTALTAPQTEDQSVEVLAYRRHVPLPAISGHFPYPAYGRMGHARPGSRPLPASSPRPVTPTPCTNRRRLQRSIAGSPRCCPQHGTAGRGRQGTVTCDPIVSPGPSVVCGAVSRSRHHEFASVRRRGGSGQSLGASMETAVPRLSLTAQTGPL